MRPAFFLVLLAVLPGCGARSLNLPSSITTLTTRDVWVREVTVRPKHDIEETTHPSEESSPPQKLTAACEDEKVCKIIVEPTLFPRLEIVAVGAGATRVKTTYRLRDEDNPADHESIIKVKIATAKPLVELAVGKPLPSGEFSISPIPSVFSNASPNEPARCRSGGDDEASGWFRDAKGTSRFTCDVPRDVAGVVRYCTGECKRWNGEKVKPTFAVCVAITDKMVTGFAVAVREGNSVSVPARGGALGEKACVPISGKGE